MCTNAVDIWIAKPHVIHKRIFGSRITHHSESLITRIVYPKLHTHILPFEESIAVTKSGKFEFFGHIQKSLPRMHSRLNLVRTASLSLNLILK